MLSITDLLKRHPVPGLKQAAIRGECAEALSNTLGLTVSPKSVKYDAGVLTLSLAPVAKSAALVKQVELKEALEKKGLSLTEIR